MRLWGGGGSMRTKEQRRQHCDALAARREEWRRRNRYYHQDLEALIARLVPAGRSVLDVGCGTGALLAAARPSLGVGIDFSSAMIEVARSKHPSEHCPNLEYRVDDIEALELDARFDYVLMVDVVGGLTDIAQALRNLHRVTADGSKIIVTFPSPLWSLPLRVAERLGLKMPWGHDNWLTLGDMEDLLALNGLEVVSKGSRMLIPVRIPLVSGLINRVLTRLPLLRRLCLFQYLVVRPRPELLRQHGPYSVSVVVPCRNERGNVRAAVERTPAMGSHTEIVFVDGNSNDGTVEEIEAVIAEQRRIRDIRLVHQVPRDSAEGEGHGRMLRLGKGDAVRKGFAAANGEILMILDADLTVPPEDLPKFYDALAEGHGELVNGTRLVYPMEQQAMRTLNRLANRWFSWLFTWLLDQRIRDTLCGTKVLFRADYERIAAGREYFGDFDPFGDFDLLFGAAKLNLKIVEVPIRYRERTYGEIKIERFRHGLLLFKMSLIAMRKLKFC